jgi:hypothetical protein
MRRQRSRDVGGALQGGRRWPYFVSLTIFAGLWTALMLAVGFAVSGEDNRSLPPLYYVFLFGGLFLAGVVAFGIARGSGRALARSLLTAFLVVTGSFLTPVVAITAAIVASGGG